MPWYKFSQLTEKLIILFNKKLLLIIILLRSTTFNCEYILNFDQLLNYIFMERRRERSLVKIYKDIMITKRDLIDLR